ncbi:MAG TPA: chitobiase/beta-hexosaminidase C-terminal domain-containing protein, partial [Burkholderiaceae bacterium]|nr:chitobiase/beta-hexosaminidase C-terminal domain-containing protein [Burkholderiaceae bacterium]
MRNHSVFSQYAGFRTVLWGLLLYTVLALVSQNKAWPDVVAEALAPPSFSHDSGFYDQPFDLVLTHPDPGVQIFYTLDGSIPDPDNLDGTRYQYKNEYAAPPGPPTGELLQAEYRTLLYTNAIPIRDRTGEPDRL